MLSLGFAPMFPWALIGGLAALGCVIIGYGLYRRSAGIWWRALAVAALALALTNPVLVEEERNPLSDVATIVVDESPSQGIAGRDTTTESALAYLRGKLEQMDGLDVKVVRAGGGRDGRARPADGTRLFEPLGRALTGVPRKRMGATFLITDGQVHDAPDADGALPFSGPLHVLITGGRKERDRMLVVEHVPSYALVGKETEIKIRVEDRGSQGGRARVTLTRAGEAPRTIDVEVGKVHTVPLQVKHAGPNIVQMEVEPGAGELTTANNRGVVQISGVRERLRVLLVSGEPHPGERVWRNLLKADPSVDLVHFTILRPPEKQDSTPVRELSLIAFPIRELFEVKLEDFDLIIFDRYRRRGVLPAIYLDNIARFIERGGAVLEAAGPAFATTLSLHRTPLGAVLPGKPTGKVFERGLLPRLTKTGGRHPVTADLVGADAKTPRWGRWFRQIDVVEQRGDSLLSGIGDRPLLILERVGEGRVAQLLSDHIWLWARGYEGGGPHSELLRRLSHWLMKEPELEENDLRAQVEGNKLAIMRRSLKPDPTPVEVTAPSGKKTTLTLEEGVGGRSRAAIPADEIGVYRISDGTRTTLAAVGNLNAKEYADMRATADKLAGLAAKTGGGIHWLEDGSPSVRRVRAGRMAAGRGWLGVVANREYSVASVHEVPLLPGLAVLLLGLGALILAWRREGR